MTQLSILIPARREMFLSKTIEDILANIEGDTEIIAVLDGEWAEPPIKDNPKVTLIYHSVSIGQRAATNEAAKVSKARFVMKVDAHCAFDKGFDVKMMADMQDDWTMVPIMRNLHTFDWVCPDGHRRYQGPSGPCKECGKETTRDVVWFAKPSPQSKSYCFDSTPHFQYFRDFNKRPEGQGELTETMSLQGSCFMMTREKYFELGVCDEAFGSWGSQGIEVSLRTWLSGGRVMVNHKTWYAHMFRTQGADFGFPYPMAQANVEFAKKSVRELFFNDNWPKQVRPLSWLIDKFWPIPGWTEDDRARVRESGERFMQKAKMKQPTKGIVYYSDNRLEEYLFGLCQKQIKQSVNGLDIVSVSLKPIPFGRNIVLDKERGILTMFEQILAGLEASTADIIFFTEHDVLYGPSHFQFVPHRKDVVYYNTNVYKVRREDGHAVRVDFCQQTSGLCAYRELLLEHYRKRVERVKREGYNRNVGFEPATHSFPRGIDNYRAESWESPYPILDIRHDKNLTPSRWSPTQFRNPKFARGWTEVSEIPGWGVTKGRFDEFLRDIENGVVSL